MGRLGLLKRPILRGLQWALAETEHSNMRRSSKRPSLLKVPDLWWCNRAIVTTWMGSLRLALLETGYTTPHSHPIEFGVKELGGRRVFCRPGTTDTGVLKCTFKEQYHLPALTLRAPRVIVDLGANVGYNGSFCSEI